MSKYLPLRIDISGQRRGKLLIGEHIGESVMKFYRCTCDCGAVVDVPDTPLWQGAVRSCGCDGEPYHKAFGHYIRRVNDGGAA